MNKEQEEFSSLFQLTPSISILGLNIDNQDINTTLTQLLQPYDGILTTIKSNNLKEIRVKAKRSSYDYAILSNSILNCDNKDILMKIVASAIRDSGYIIILEDRSEDVNFIYELLEEFDFGAISQVDIFKNYYLIIGKKLHMWGM